MKIAIVDYGLGNLFSLSNAFQHCGQKTFISNDPGKILDANALILPGVGAFSEGIERLRKLSLDRTIAKFAEQNKFILGICLGMQLLMDTSEEFGSHRGLGLIEGEVQSFVSFKNFNMKEKTLHVGWNDLEITKKCDLLNDLGEEGMYFIHSFCVNTRNRENTVAIAQYGGVDFSAVIRKENIYGCQFHPEKSAENGLKILRNFLEMISN
jgi:glutamine amidotransferase